jgi:predicted CoA-binding protein
VTHENPSDARVRELLTQARTIAVVGASSSPERPSHGIFQRLLAHGYRVVPVNPNETAVLGQKAYPTLADVPDQIDIVDVFRRAEHTPDVARDAVAVGAKALWLQSGIWNDAAAETAREGGLEVVMDSCIGVEISVLGIPKKP